jgi:hypothetical protein
MVSSNSKLSNSSMVSNGVYVNSKEKNFLNNNSTVKFGVKIKFDTTLNKWVKYGFPENWSKFTESKYNKEANFAVLTGRKNNVIVVDIDKWKLFEEYFGSSDLPETLTTKTPNNNGRHLYFNYTEELSNTYKKNTEIGIDLLSNGACAIQGFQYDLIDGCYEINDIPQEWISIIKGEGVSSTVLERIVCGLSKERAKPYNSWVEVGMAIKNTSNTTAGKQLFHKFSSSYEEYKVDETDKKWNSFNDNGRLTIRTLYYLLKQDNKTLWNELKKDVKNEKEVRPEDTVIARMFKELYGDKYVFYANSWFKKEEADKSYDLVNTKDLQQPENKWVIIRDDEIYNIINSVEFSEFCFIKRIENNTFLESVLKALKRQLFQEMVFNPYKKSEYNLFNGFKAKYTAGVKEEDIIVFLEYFKTVCCNNDEEKYKYLLSWFSYMLIGRNKTALILFGEMGTGKSVLADFFMEHIIGKEICLKTSDLNQVLGNFNGARHNKVIINLEEVNVNSRGKQNTKAVNDLKNAITSDDMVVRNLYQECKVEDSFNNLIFTSNHNVPVPIDMNDRRYSIFKFSDVYRGNKEYYDILNETIRNDEYASKVYSFLMDYDRGDYSPHRVLKTEDGENMKYNSTSVGCFVKLLRDGEHEIFNDVLKEDDDDKKDYTEEMKKDGEFKIKSTVLYNAYERYCREELGNKYSVWSKKDFPAEFTRTYGADKVKEKRERPKVGDVRGSITYKIITL